MATNVPITGETPITIKISIGEDIKKLKLPLKDLTAEVLPAKLISVLTLPTDKKVTFQRFSDSAGSFITLDSSNSAVYKTLIRAAKAKLKLRLRALIEGEPTEVPSQRPTTLSADLLARPEVVARLAKLPQMAEHNDAFQGICKAKHPRRAMSSASARKNIGAGIFDFKDALATTQTPKWQSPFQLDALSAQPPRLFEPFKSASAAKATPKASLLDRPVSFLEAYGTDMKSFASECEPVLVYRRKASVPNRTWSVYCNECDATLNDEHFHCSVCDAGDFDLCQRCVDEGKLCPGEGHWLVKRSIKNGMIVSSSTERLPPKPKVPKAPTPVNIIVPMVSTKSTLPMRPYSAPKINNVIPGAFTDDAKTMAEDFDLSTRTCNSCVEVMTDDHFVTCKTCDDYDLCIKCCMDNKHGHHPGHEFTPAVFDKTLSQKEQELLAPGRQVRHMALCDGCDKTIIGVRHKCFDCPDFDYCNDCVRGAHLTHPDHRFSSIYEPITLVNKMPVTHHGIYCDGPTCSSNPRQFFITGVRYKCVICNDTDFCANCEALPNNTHNKTHPLLKISSPVRGLSICTVNDPGNGNIISGLGDSLRTPTRTAPDVALGAPGHLFQVPIYATAQPAVKAVDLSHADSADSAKTVASTGQSLARDSAKNKDAEVLDSSSAAADKSELQAVFVCDTIPDGITVRGDARFTQVWTLRNPGPLAWPAGCSVRFVGGDNMLNVDRQRPFSVMAMAEATESSVIGREVLPGEEVSFKVILKAPDREGRAISYWRLKTSDGTQFGHRLWCDINVRACHDACFPASTEQQQQLYPLQSPVDAIGSDAQQRAEESKLSALEHKLARMHDQARRASPPADAPASGEEHRPLKIANLRATRIALERSREAAAANIARLQHDFQAVARSYAEVRLTDEAALGEQKQPELSESPMVYPTLEKESPASSTCNLSKSTNSGRPEVITPTDGSAIKAKAATMEDETTGDVVSATMPSTSRDEAPEAEEEDEVFEDVSSDELLSASGEDSDVDGFLTDEEYDILDASDQETIASSDC